MEVKILKKTLKEVSSYKTSYIVTPSTNPEGIVEVEAIFSDLDDRQKKYLINAINRRNWKVVDTLIEKQNKINPHTKKILRNSAIYFGITYLSSLGGIQFFSPQLGVTIEAIQTLILSLIPAASAFLTRLAVELKIE